MFQMPRKYKRKTSKKYTIEDLKAAVREIKEKKISFRKAEEKYSVPRSTLLDQMKKQDSDITEPKRGNKPVFNNSQEEELVKLIVNACRNFYGITIPSLRKIAYEFASANGLKNNFDKKVGMAGMDWYYGFMARHPYIALRKPEATSLSRISAFNAEEVELFFDNLCLLMSKHKFKTNDIYNVDETGISTVQRNSRILAIRGLKQVGKCTSGERGTLTTVVNACSAAGYYIPPFFIFKRKRMNPLLMKQSNNNMIASVSDSGWISEKLFVDWLHHFKSFARPSLDNPILLILDNHESHISLAAYNICKKNNIHVLTLPPHTSHRMQPLDLTFHGPLKTAYNKECESYMTNNPGAKITTFDVVGLYTKAFNRTTTLEKAISGFKAAGICPMDKEKFKATFESFGDISITQQNQNSPRALTTNADESRNESRNSISNREPLEQYNISLPIDEPQGTLESIVELFDVVGQNFEHNDISMNEVVSEIDQAVHQNIVEENEQNTNHCDNTQAVHSIQRSETQIGPLTNIVNIPTMLTFGNKNKRVTKKKHSIILTSTPEKQELVKKQQKKIEKKTMFEKNNSNTENKRSKTETQKNKRNVNKGVKNLKEFREVEKEEEYFCLFCSEKYFSPPAEDWIMCIMCQKWAHENCTGGSTSTGYICDLCSYK